MRPFGADRDAPRHCISSKRAGSRQRREGVHGWYVERAIRENGCSAPVMKAALPRTSAAAAESAAAVPAAAESAPARTLRWRGGQSLA
ncbi:MAG: hypothetical protein WC483_06395, partial [Candidatus Paceibacterota bacterium]